MKAQHADVAIERCESYAFEPLLETIRKCAESSGFPDIKDKVVLVKPNILTDAKPDDCITTNPVFVKAVIRYIKSKGPSKVLVGDSPGMQGISFKPTNCGIWDACNEEDVEWVDFTKDSVTMRIPGTNQKLPIAKAVLDADVVIGACKFKTHQLMYTTGAIKNFFGVVPGLNKGPCHMKNPTRESFARLVCGINEIVKPAFSFMDAIIGMEGPGPANGYPRALNLVLSSSNGAALDLAEATIMGYKAENLPMVRETIRRGMLQPSDIGYPILDPKSLIIEDFKAIPFREKIKFVSTLIIPYCTRGIQRRRQKTNPAPIFDESKCEHCLKCVRICPAKALSFKDGNVVADYKKCIRCYCCHEMCPADAITITKK